MGHSSLLGVERADLEPAGRDTAVLGPSDSSDSGSDVAGIEELDGGDPAEPVDRALRADRQRSLTPGDRTAGGSSDSAGSGESRSAAADGGIEAADISVDRIVEGVPDGPLDDEEDPDLSFMDQASAAPPEEDEEADKEGDEDAKPAAVIAPAATAASRKRPPQAGLRKPMPRRGKAAKAAKATASAPVPGKPNPLPDPPRDPDKDHHDDEIPDDEGDEEKRKPGRG